MSAARFLLASLAVGLAVFGAVWLIAKLLALLPARNGEARPSRLQRRLERRLARGTDAYFEELRSIEAAIAAEAAERPHRRRDWFAFPYVLVMPAYALVVGAMLLKLLPDSWGLVVPSDWAHALSSGIWPLLGLMWIIDPPADRDAARIGRVMGVLVLLVGTVDVAHQFHCLFSPTPRSSAE